jgi:propanol-preferring alcohol dehydrogenase
VKAIRYDGENRISIAELPDPEPSADDLLIRVTASAVCASERGGYASPGGSPSNGGHETVGVVLDARSARTLKAGDRVLVYPVCGCGACRHCLGQEFTKCADYRFLPPGHCELIAAPERALIPIPEGLTDAAALALLGCGIGVAYGGASALDLPGARTVFVVGLGPIGLASVMLHRFLGAYVIGSDLHEARLRLAEQLGAHATIQAGECDPVERARELTGGVGPDATIECSGAQAGFRQALSAVRVGGTVIALGGSRDNLVSAFPDLSSRYITLKGVWHYHRHQAADLFRLVVAGLDPTPLVTHIFPYPRAQEAYDLFSAGQTGKVVLTWV